MELLEKARALLSHKTGGNLKSTFLEMAEEVIRARKPKEKSLTQTSKSTATVAVKTMTPRLKREILHRHQMCQFKDETTGRICGSKYFLEVDHIKPKYAQGTNEAHNLRILCKNHNIFRYQAGI